MRWLTLGVVTLLALSLQSCGFHLQGAATLPPEMSKTRLEAQNPYSQFVRQLTIYLGQNGATLVESPDYTAILEVSLNRVRKEILSIGDTARIREYRIRHTVRFRLMDAAGNELQAEQTLERTRVISFDEQDILAATREEEFLRQELADTMARLVLRELETSRT